jgi:hypothetical protein
VSRTGGYGRMDGGITANVAQPSFWRHVMDIVTRVSHRHAMVGGYGVLALPRLARPAGLAATHCRSRPRSQYRTCGLHRLGDHQFDAEAEFLRRFRQCESGSAVCGTAFRRAGQPRRR